MTKVIRHNIYISLLFILLFSNHNCSAQNEKIKLSSIINSMYFSKDRGVVPSTEKMFFCMSIKKETKIPKLEEVLEFDSFNSNKFELLYANDEKKILQKLKKNNFIDVIHAPTCQRDVDNLVLILDIGSIDYKLFKKSKFKFTMRGDVFKIHYKSINNKWIVDHIDRI